MAVKTVNAQGYDAVMAASRANSTKSAAAANSANRANAASGGMQDFGAMLDKAGEKAAGSDYAQASKSKSPARQEIRADKSSAQDSKTAAAKDVKDAESAQAITEKNPAGGARADEAKTGEAKTENAKAEEGTAEKAEAAKAAAEKAEAKKAEAESATKAADTAETGESREESDNMAAARISDALMQIIGQIKDLLGVSDAELLIGLERADLQLVDLLNPANMPKLLTEIAGEGNVMNLVTDGELYAKLQELAKTAENVSSQLLDELGLTREEFDAVLEKLKLERLLQLENADALKDANQQNLPNPQTENDGAAAGAKADADAVTQTEAKLAAEVKLAAEDQTEAKPSAETEAKPAAEQKQSAETEAKPSAATEETAAAKPEQSAEAEAKPVTDAEAKADASTKSVNEAEKAQNGEEARAAAEEDADTLAQAKQPEKTAADEAKDITESSAAKKQADATVQNQQNETVNVGEQQAKAKNQSNLQNAQERGGSDGKKGKSDNFNGQPNAQSFDSTAKTAMSETVQAAAETLARYASENTRSILRQLADIVRVARNENLTQMEMQLHPASLGTVNVSLVTKGGAVTAHFTTQNEAVKAAVEAQAVQLVSNLESQGVKVEAVEVTVAGHQLEKNLDENSRNEQSRQEREESQRVQGSRRSSINLNLYEDDEEMLEEMQGADDATRIAMELMAANGNSMDLMA